MQMEKLGHFLFTYLRDRGVKHCFGIPGDYIIPLYVDLEATEGIEAVVATHEPCAAFSADAYGRQTGLGVLLATYGVGAFNALNGVAGAYAERSPLVVISGGPPRGYSHGSDLFEPLKHHVVRTPSDQLEVYQRVTDLALRIEAPEQAAPFIRRVVLHAERTKLPVYLEIPTDLMTAQIPVDGDADGAGANGAVGGTMDQEILAHAVQTFSDRMARAQRPVLLIGEEVSRYQLEPVIQRLMNTHGAPTAMTVLGKGALAEGQPGVLGVYAGVMTPDPDVRAMVEQADLVVMLGAKVTDVNCGVFTADLHRDRMLIAKTGWVGDGYRRYTAELPFPAFLQALVGSSPVQVDVSAPLPVLKAPGPAPAGQEAGISLMDRYLQVINDDLRADDVVVADTGDACYGSLFFRTQRLRGYLAPTFYNTMGFAVPAALGAQLAEPGSRPVVLVGDGAFQMTGLEMANMVRQGLDPIILLFNNGGFGMQRIFADGAFNDHGEWRYGRMTDLLGGGQSWQVKDPAELTAALASARDYRLGPSLIEVLLPKGVISTGLRIMGEALTREKQGSCPMSPAGAEACEHESKCAYCRAAVWR